MENLINKYCGDDNASKLKEFSDALYQHNTAFNVTDMHQAFLKAYILGRYSDLDSNDVDSFWHMTKKFLEFLENR